jgi:hypothetical protein
MRRTASEIIHDLETRVTQLEKQAGIFDIFKDNRLTLQELERLLYKTDAGPFEVVDVEVKNIHSVDVTFENPKNGRTVTVYGYVQTHTGADEWFKQAGAQHFMALRGFPSFGGGRPDTISIPFNYDERDRTSLGSALGIKIDPKKKRVWLDWGDLKSDIG